MHSLHEVHLCLLTCQAPCIHPVARSGQEEGKREVRGWRFKASKRAASEIRPGVGEERKQMHRKEKAEEAKPIEGSLGDLDTEASYCSPPSACLLFSVPYVA